MNQIVICDIDGTIADCTHRIGALAEHPKNWARFYNGCGDDSPIEKVCDLIKFLQHKHTIVFMTGRPEAYRIQTRTWLKQYLPDCADRLLIMRKDGDHRPDYEVKPEMAEEAGLLPSEVSFIFEDRSSVVKTWRRLGYTVLQVAEGDF